MFRRFVDVHLYNYAIIKRQTLRKIPLINNLHRRPPHNIAQYYTTVVADTKRIRRGFFFYFDFDRFGFKALSWEKQK